MRLTEQEIKQIIKEEFANLVNEEEIDEKLLSALKGIGKGLFDKATDFMSGKPKPNASQGVGRAFARYKVPQKQPIQPEPEIEPGVGLVRRNASQGMQTSVPGYSGDSQSNTDNQSWYDTDQQPQIGTGEPAAPQDFQPFGALPPPPAIKQQLLLSEPTKIGVTDKVGELLNDTNSESYKLLFGEIARSFKTSGDFESLNAEQKQQSDDYINTILKSLTNTGRILSNPTFTSVDENLKQQVPSVRQIEKDSGVFDSYIVKALINSIKQKLGNIPLVIIEFVINSLHEEGRLAISTRMYNSLKHTDDPRLKKLTAESKSYNNFYNNWKRYTKPGVKI